MRDNKRRAVGIRSKRHRASRDDRPEGRSLSNTDRRLEAIIIIIEEGRRRRREETRQNAVLQPVAKWSAESELFRSRVLANLLSCVDMMDKMVGEIQSTSLTGDGQGPLVRIADQA